MKINFPFMLLVIGLLTACDKTSVNDDVTESYGLPDKSSAYEQLATTEAENLSDDELYERALTLWNTPYRELSVPTSTGTAHVVVSGPVDAEAIVLLHGMGTDATMWYPNAKTLSENFRVYAIDDILGPGKSEPSGGEETIGRVVSWYFEVFDALELENINLIGASQGGWIATNIALNKPEQFKSLILLSPAQTFAWLEPSLDIFSNVLFALNPQRDKLKEILATQSSNVEAMNPIFIDHYYRTFETAPPSPLLLEMKPFDDDQLATLTMPILVLVGDDDLFNDQDSIDRANETLSCVHAEVINDSGHFISADRSQLVNTMIKEFVNRKMERNDSTCPK